MTGARGRAGACAAVAAVIFAAVTGLPPAASGAQGRELPSAEAIHLRGVEKQLLNGDPDEFVRVGLVLSAQPVLARAATRSFEAAISRYTRGDLQAAARQSPHQVSSLERQARRNERDRQGRILRTIREEVAAARRLERRLASAIERNRVRVVSRGDAGVLAMVTAHVRRHRLAWLAARPAVQAVIHQPAPVADLDTSAVTVAASAVWHTHNGGSAPADVRSDIEVGLSSDAPDPSHPAFSGIAIDNGGASPGAHGTTTAGVLASQDSTYRGIAPGIARLRGGGADTFDAEDPVDVRSQSFGYEPTSDDLAGVADLQAHTYLVPWAASAGNYNYDMLKDEPYPDVQPGSPTTGGNAMGRNIISAGAFGDASTEDPRDDFVAPFSSFGPTPGGRKKPDLTAPGVAITGPARGGGIDTDSGTSLAAPHVAGAQAILVGAGISDPRVIRSLLINSADPWCNGHNHQPPQGAALPPAGTCQTGWLPDVGWGELDVEDALAERGNAVLGDVEGGKARFYSATVDPGDRATLAWNLRGVLGQFVQDHVYFTVTNLDLRQYQPDGTEIPPPTDPGWGAGPDAVDPNDTVEQVRAASPGGEVVYKVEAASTVEGAPTERFGLASSNPLDPLESPDVLPVDVAQSNPGPVNCTSHTIDVTARLRNPSSDIKAEDPRLTLELPSGLALVSGAVTQTVGDGTLAEGVTSEQVTWTLRATRSGTHAAVVRGEGGAYGTVFENRVKAPSVIADCSPPKDAPSDGFESPPPADDGDASLGAVRLLGTRLKHNRRAGRLRAAGRLVGSDGSRITGRVRLKVRKPGGAKRRRTVALDDAGRFRARFGACRAGRYRAWITWRGDALHNPLRSAGLGATRSSGC